MTSVVLEFVQLLDNVLFAGLLRCIIHGGQSALSSVKHMNPITSLVNQGYWAESNIKCVGQINVANK